MRHLLRFEKRNDPFASSKTFSSRLFRNSRWALAIIVISITIGMAGLMGFEGMGGVDAFASAAMILAGVGMVGDLHTTAGKIFVGVYSIAGGLLIFGIAGLILAPIFHRILHRFHVQDDSTHK